MSVRLEVECCLMGREEALAREVVAKEHAQSDEHEQVECTYACACFTRWRVCTATKVERCFVRMYVDKSALWTLLLLLHAMWQTMHRKLEREMEKKFRRLDNDGSDRWGRAFSC